MKYLKPIALILLFTSGVTFFKQFTLNQMGIILCVGSQGFLFAYIKTGNKGFRSTAIVLNLAMITALLNFELKPEKLHTADIIYETGGTIRASEQFAEKAGKTQVEAESRDLDEWRRKMEELNARVQERKRRLLKQRH